METEWIAVGKPELLIKATVTHPWFKRNTPKRFLGAKLHQGPNTDSFRLVARLTIDPFRNKIGPFASYNTPRFYWVCTGINSSPHDIEPSRLTEAFVRWEVWIEKCDIILIQVPINIPEGAELKIEGCQTILLNEGRK